MIQAVLALVIVAQEAPTSPTRAQPLEPPASWLTFGDYPFDALRRRAQGTVRFRLSIDQHGQPTRCVIEQSSNDRVLDETSCSLLMSRARFRPARDAGGGATPDTYVSQIRWTIPYDPLLIGSAPMRIVNTLRAEPSGLVECNVVMNDRAPPTGIGFGCDIDFTHDEVRRFEYRMGPRAIEIIDSIGYAPDPAQLPPPSTLTPANPYYRTEVRLNVTADGSVADCQLVRRDRQGLRSGPRPPNVCNYYLAQGRTLFAPTPGLVGSRLIHVTHDYFLRVTEIEPEVEDEIKPG